MLAFVVFCSVVVMERRVGLRERGRESERAMGGERAEG